jgi:hypothetical protein
LVIRPAGLGPPGSEPDLSDGATNAAGACAGLRRNSETDDQLRMRARRQLDPDEIAQLRQLERLAVQGRGWVLCTDGACTAAATANWMVSLTHRPW